jgi:hypothetical protein
MAAATRTVAAATIILTKTNLLRPFSPPFPRLAFSFIQDFHNRSLRPLAMFSRFAV